MVLVSTKEQCVKVEHFSAEVIVYRTHHTTIRVGYETMVHVNSVRAVAKLVEIKEKKKVKLRKSSEAAMLKAAEAEDNVKSLSLGDRAIIRLQFKQRPRYISIGDRVLLAETKIKMTGRVTEIET
jgi:GTPase